MSVETAGITAGLVGVLFVLVRVVESLISKKKPTGCNVAKDEITTLVYSQQRVMDRIELLLDSTNKLIDRFDRFRNGN